LPNVGPYIYTSAFLALLGAPYIYDISSLRVKIQRIYKTHTLTHDVTLRAAIIFTLTNHNQSLKIQRIYKTHTLTHDVT